MHIGEAQVVEGRLVTGPQRTLGRTLTWAGGWGLERVREAREPHPDPLPSTKGIEEARPVWQRVVAMAAGVAAVLALFGLVAVHRARSRPEAAAPVVAPPPIAPAPAAAPAPPPAAPAEQPAARPPVPLPAAPKPAPLPAATRVKAAVRTRPPAATRQRPTQPPPAAAWVDPFDDGSWVDLPAGKR
jgi:hypothetical protein